MEFETQGFGNEMLIRTPVLDVAPRGCVGERRNILFGGFPLLYFYLGGTSPISGTEPIKALPDLSPHQDASMRDVQRGVGGRTMIPD